MKSHIYVANRTGQELINAIVEYSEMRMVSPSEVKVEFLSGYAMISLSSGKY
jgi:hypothetical protein